MSGSRNTHNHNSFIDLKKWSKLKSVSRTSEPSIFDYIVVLVYSGQPAFRFKIYSI